MIAGFLPSSALPAFRLVGSNFFVGIFDMVYTQTNTVQTSRAYSGLPSIKSSPIDELGKWYQERLVGGPGQV